MRIELLGAFRLLDGAGDAVETPIGYMPTKDAIDRTGLKDVSDADMDQLLAMDKEGWLNEIEMVKEHYAKFGDKLPKTLSDQLEALIGRLS